MRVTGITLYIAHKCTNADNPDDSAYISLDADENGTLQIDDAHCDYCGGRLIEPAILEYVRGLMDNVAKSLKYLNVSCTPLDENENPIVYMSEDYPMQLAEGIEEVKMEEIKPIRLLDDED